MTWEEEVDDAEAAKAESFKLSSDEEGLSKLLLSILTLFLLTDIILLLIWLTDGEEDY